MNFSRCIFLWIMHTVVASHGSVPPDTPQPPLEILRGYSWRVGLKRERRSVSEPGYGAVCNADDLERDPDKCCKKCPPGYHYAKSSKCGGWSDAGRCFRCLSNRYIDQMNRREECEKCTDCDDRDSVILKPCTPERNTQCGCKKGYYTSDPDPHNYLCEKCSECSNRFEATACSEKGDTECGHCIPDFYEDHGTCQHCQPQDFWRAECQNQTTTHPITKTPITTQGPSSEESLVLVVFSICVVTILILGFLCCFLNLCTCRELLILSWNWRDPPKQPCQFYPGRDVPQDRYSENHQHLLTAVSKSSLQVPKRNVSQDTTTELQVNTGVCSPATSLRKEADPRALREDLHTSNGLPAAVLYAVIREVPARRWKEFLRLLSVTDAQMERAEMEAGPCYLEQQYQMLRLWSQKGGAALEAAYSALHSMHLSGCAQELQEKLQQLQQQVA